MLKSLCSTSYLLFCEQRVCVSELEKKREGEQKQDTSFSIGCMQNNWMIMQLIITTYVNIVSLPDFWMCLFNQTVHKTRLNRIIDHIRSSSQTDAKCVKYPKSSSPEIFLFLGRSSLDKSLIHHWLEHAARETLRWDSNLAMMEVSTQSDIPD